MTDPFFLETPYKKFSIEGLKEGREKKKKDFIVRGDCLLIKILFTPTYHVCVGKTSYSIL